MLGSTRESAARALAGGEGVFTLIELVAVLLILGVLAAVALPRFLSISTAARIAALESIAGGLRSTVDLVQAKAIAQGLRAVESNPGAGQAAFLVESELGTTEIDWRNLCPESSAELGDALDMSDYLQLGLEGDLSLTVDNQFTRVGYEITNSLTNGCYVVYDSFGLPDCTVTVVTTDC